MPSFHNSIGVRLIESGDSIEVRPVRLDSQGGFDPGKIAARKTIKLSPEQVKGFRSRLENAAFWTMKPSRKDPDGGGVADGDQLVLEGIKGGEYHVVHRDDAEPSYLESCRYILFELSGFDQTKTWSDYRP